MSYGSVIAAISTPSGKGGVALIRVSGEGAIELCDKIFIPRSKRPLREAASRMQIYGDILHRGEIIDDGLATLFRAPHSYTGEDTVEITCHGGILITEKVLEAILLAGAHPAERGEFTERAFINGKLSLTDAEAIGNLLDAKSDEQIKLSSDRSRGKLGEAIEKIRNDLTTLLASIFARIDYPDEDLGDFTDEETVARLESIEKDLSALISTYPTSRAINEGISTVILGKTNVGKSSLYNAILAEDAAIVTDIEGTTRDVLSRTIPLGRVMLRLSDTAGVRSDEHADEVEKIGIKKTLDAIRDAELTVAVFDASRNFDAEDERILSILSASKSAKIAVLNKSDLEYKIDSSKIIGFDGILTVSAKTDSIGARAELAREVNRLFTNEKLKAGEDAIVLSARQNAALIAAKSYVDSGIAALRSGEFSDAAASEIELALARVGELDGKAVAEEVVAEIFSKFCVGK